MTTVSFMGANFVARQVGYNMTDGWGQGDAATNEYFRPLATSAYCVNGLHDRIGPPSRLGEVAGRAGDAVDSAWRPVVAFHGLLILAVLEWVAWHAIAMACAHWSPFRLRAAVPAGKAWRGGDPRAELPVIGHRARRRSTGQAI
jgi:hypothetical protein